jgi:hypothetical protein
MASESCKQQPRLKCSGNKMHPGALESTLEAGAASNQRIVVNLQANYRKLARLRPKQKSIQRTTGLGQRVATTSMVQSSTHIISTSYPLRYPCMLPATCFLALSQGLRPALLPTNTWPLARHALCLSLRLSHIIEARRRKIQKGNKVPRLASLSV